MTDAERQQIERILQSKAFRGSEVQRNLLAYLAEKYPVNAEIKV